MYGYEWTDKNGIFRLVATAKVKKEIRPVFWEELDYFGFDAHWSYPKTDAPLLWAEGIRRYVLNGELVAEAVGGGFYTKPTINIIKRGLELKPISIDALWKENERLMLGLENTALDFIRQTHDEYAKQGMEFVVAFSGGKDSLVLLDLVAKALEPDKFVVIFGNTDMELRATLEAVERAKKHWSKLRFYEAKSHMTAEESWDAFGPPGRRMRWCCAVHKSVPTILKLREIAKNSRINAVVYEGVRAEESHARSDYEFIRDKVKNINQVNVSPILTWGTAEVYLHLMKTDLLLNVLYRIGFNRVGCTICPMSSPWRDHLSNGMYKNEVTPLLGVVEDYVERVKPAKGKLIYIEKGGWRARMGGRNLKNGGNRVVEVVDENKITFRLSSKTGTWLNVAKLLGAIVNKNGNNYTQLIGNQTYEFSIKGDTICYKPFSQMDRYVLSRLRGVAYKVAYCVGCMACEVQCPVGAFGITEKRNILIREELCINCGNCISFTDGKGCLVAKSVSTTEGNNMELKGMNRYQTFGFRRPWLEHFFQHGVDCFAKGELGNRQYDALRIWLREAELLSPTGKGEKSGIPTLLCEKLIPLGDGNPMTWAIIWTNLAYNSIIVKWYMLFAQTGETYDKPELVFMLGDDYSPSTRDNAVTALLETLRHSPIGTALKQGIPIPNGQRSFKFVKQGWDTPEATAILYALYKFAEVTGRYTFTLKQLESARGNHEAKGVDPVSIFGLSPPSFKGIMQDIALQYPDYVRVAFVQDLDNVMLVPEKKAIDIIDLITE